MQLERYNGCGSTEMDTPYGKATLEVTHEATAMMVSVRDAERRIVLRTKYSLTSEGWVREDAKRGVRSATWGFAVSRTPAKDRRNMLTVVDALVVAWARDHKAEVASVKVASLRAQAWNMMNNANYYANLARELQARANDAEVAA